MISLFQYSDQTFVILHVDGTDKSHYNELRQQVTAMDLGWA